MAWRSLSVARRAERMRELAVRAFTYVDSDSRLRRALTTQHRPPRRLSVAPGMQVMFWNQQRAKLNKGPTRRIREARGWHGPAVAVAADGPNCWWVKFRGTLYRIPVEMLRDPTSEEMCSFGLVVDELNATQRDLEQVDRGCFRHEDLRRQEPPGASEFPPPEPDGPDVPEWKRAAKRAATADPDAERPFRNPEGHAQAEAESVVFGNSPPRVDWPQVDQPVASSVPAEDIVESSSRASRLDGHRVRFQPYEGANLPARPNESAHALDRAVLAAGVDNLDEMECAAVWREELLQGWHERGASMSDAPMAETHLDDIRCCAAFCSADLADSALPPAPRHTFEGVDYISTSATWCTRRTKRHRARANSSGDRWPNPRILRARHADRVQRARPVEGHEEHRPGRTGAAGASPCGSVALRRQERGLASRRTVARSAGKGPADRGRLQRPGSGHDQCAADGCPDRRRHGRQDARHDCRGQAVEDRE